LAGYKDGQEVPAYRQLQAELKFHNPFLGWVPDCWGTHDRPCYLSVAEISAMLESSDEPSFVVIVDKEIVARYVKKTGFDTDVKSDIQRASFANILDAVRKAVLDWALKLEQAGISHGEK
jgi:hypothetical protein